MYLLVDRYSGIELACVEGQFNKFEDVIGAAILYLGWSRNAFGVEIHIQGKLMATMRYSFHSTGAEFIGIERGHRFSLFIGYIEVFVATYRLDC